MNSDLGYSLPFNQALKPLQGQGYDLKRVLSNSPLQNKSQKQSKYRLSLQQGYKMQQNSSKLSIFSINRGDNLALANQGKRASVQEDIDKHLENENTNHNYNYFYSIRPRKKSSVISEQSGPPKNPQTILPSLHSVSSTKELLSSKSQPQTFRIKIPSLEKLDELSNVSAIKVTKQDNDHQVNLVNLSVQRKNQKTQISVPAKQMLQLNDYKNYLREIIFQQQSLNQGSTKLKTLTDFFSSRSFKINSNTQNTTSNIQNTTSNIQKTISNIYTTKSNIQNAQNNTTNTNQKYKNQQNLDPKMNGSIQQKFDANTVGANSCPFNTNKNRSFTNNQNTQTQVLQTEKNIKPLEPISERQSLKNQNQFLNNYNMISQVRDKRLNEISPKQKYEVCATIKRIKPTSQSQININKNMSSEYLKQKYYAGGFQNENQSIKNANNKSQFKDIQKAQQQENISKDQESYKLFFQNFKTKTNSDVDFRNYQNYIQQQKDYNQEASNPITQKPFYKNLRTQSQIQNSLQTSIIHQTPNNQQLPQIQQTNPLKGFSYAYSLTNSPHTFAKQSPYLEEISFNEETDIRPWEAPRYSEMIFDQEIIE